MVDKDKLRKSGFMVYHRNGLRELIPRKVFPVYVVLSFMSNTFSY